MQRYTSKCRDTTPTAHRLPGCPLNFANRFRGSKMPITTATRFQCCNESLRRWETDFQARFGKNQRPGSCHGPCGLRTPPSGNRKNMSVPAKHGLWQPNMARGRRPRPCGRRPRPCGRRDKLSVARTLPRGAEQNGCAADPSSVADGQAPLRLPDGLWRTKQAGCGRASPLGRCLARVGGPCHRLAPIRQSNPNHLVEIFQRQPEMRIELRARGVNVKGSRKKTVSTGAHA